MLYEVITQDPRALEEERRVVAREAFGEPQLARHVRALEVERLEAARADPLDVPRRITSYNVCYTKLLRFRSDYPKGDFFRFCSLPDQFQIIN